ncbi:MAG: TonB-dependent receptor plug domain-containing protein, partial [Proteobacteria bacterium]|nr:TonB-dependent receptor plug domain-containing protein [Pseudomonadota bacterium]
MFALAASLARAADAGAGADAGSEAVSEVVVTGRGGDLIGRAESAGQGQVSAADLSLRPLLRPGEVVEQIPGVIITQHSGSGKANQYFLRGFNLDHGTDLAVSVDGMPVNMPSHAHGQGYADLNFL